MLVVALLSMLAGGRTCVDMEDYGGAAEPWLRTFLALENGIPSHDTFSRLFAKLDPAGLQKALLRLAQDWADRVVRMHPDKRSVRRKLIRARRDDDFLLDMIRRIRKNE